MGTLVYTTTEDYKYAGEYGPQKSSIGVWKNEKTDTYVLVRKSLIHRPRKSGAVSKFWKRENVQIFKKTKSGYCITLAPQPRGGFYSGRVLREEGLPQELRQTPGFDQWFKGCDITSTPLGNHFFSGVDTRFGTRILGSSPLFPHLYRNDTMAEFVADAFGKTRIRKDLVKAVAKSSFPSVESMWVARGIVPVDWIVDALRNSDDKLYNRPTVDLKAARWILGSVRPQAQKNILMELLEDEHGGHLRDIGFVNRRFHEIPPEVLYNRNVRNIKEVHDAVHDHLRRTRRRGQDISFELTGFKKELHEKPIGKMTFVVASNSKMLIEWGETMSNCIGSYCYVLGSDNTILAGIYEAGVLIANSELRKTGKEWSVVQLLGKYNRSLPDNQKKQIEKFYKDNNISVKDYWGKN